MIANILCYTFTYSSRFFGGYMKENKSLLWIGGISFFVWYSGWCYLLGMKLLPAIIFLVSIGALLVFYCSMLCYLETNDNTNNKTYKQNKSPLPNENSKKFSKQQ